MIPFELAFAVTYHKIQGQTVSKLILDVNCHPTLSLSLPSLRWTLSFCEALLVHELASPSSFGPQQQPLLYRTLPKPSALSFVLTVTHTQLWSARSDPSFKLSNSLCNDLPCTFPDGESRNAHCGTGGRSSLNYLFFPVNNS